MSKITICLAIALTFLLNAVFAQTDDPVQVERPFKNAISVNAGWHQAFVKDLNFAPLHFDESGFVTGLKYERLGKKSDFTFRVRFSQGLTDHPAIPSASEIQNGKQIDFVSADYIFGDLTFQYLRSFDKFSGDRLKVKLGGQYQFHIYYLNYIYQDAFSFMANHNLAVSGKLQYEVFEGHQIEVGLDIPLVSLVIRPPYNNWDDTLADNFEEGNWGAILTDGAFGTFNKLLSYDLRFIYSIEMGKRLELFGKYQNSYYNVFETNKYVSMMNEFSLGLKFKL